MEINVFNLIHSLIYFLFHSLNYTALLTFHRFMIIHITELHIWKEIMNQRKDYIKSKTLNKWILVACSDFRFTHYRSLHGCKIYDTLSSLKLQKVSRQTMHRSINTIDQPELYQNLPWIKQEINSEALHILVFDDAFVFPIKP